MSDEDELAGENSLESFTQRYGQHEGAVDFNGDLTMDDLNESFILEMEIRKKAPVIRPYIGELMPKEFPHGAFSFASTFAKTYKGPVMIDQVMSTLAPKLNELAGYRRFELDKFFSAPVAKIGKGRFGDVFRMSFDGAGRPVAVKQFKDLSNPLAIYKEVHTLIAVQHKRVVQLLGAFHDSGTYMVMQLCLGNLRQHLGALTPLQTIRFFIQLLEALRHIHSMNIIHCDVRPDNCLITQLNNVVLADFGDSQLLPPNVEFVQLDESSRLLGNKAYSDAVANSRIYSKSTDIFGLACTVFEMETGRALMQYKTWPEAPLVEYIRVVKEGRLVDYPPEYYPDAPNVESQWNLDGRRESLLQRSASALRFCTVLKDMVNHSYGRIGAAKLLERYKLFFEGLLTRRESTMDQLDKDVDLGDVRLFVDNIRKINCMDCSNDTNLAMDLIYYDSELNSQVSCTNNVTENKSDDFEAIPTDYLKFAFNQLISGNTIRVRQSGDGLPLSQLSLDGKTAKSSVSKGIHNFKTFLNKVQETNTIQDLKTKESTKDESSANDVNILKTPGKPCAEKCTSKDVVTGKSESSGSCGSKGQKPELLTQTTVLDASNKVFKMPNVKSSLKAAAPLKPSSITNLGRKQPVSPSQLELMAPNPLAKSVARQPTTVDVTARSPSPPELCNTKAYSGTALRNQPFGTSNPNKCAAKFTDYRDATMSKKRKSDSSSDEDAANDEGRSHSQVTSMHSKDNAHAEVVPLSRKKAKREVKESKEADKSNKPSSTSQIDVEKRVTEQVDEQIDQHGNRTKFWYMQQNESVPIALRGDPPASKHLPKDMQIDEDWSGWFDCKFCATYYTHDYKQIMKHMRRCSKQ